MPAWAGPWGETRVDRVKPSDLTAIRNLSSPTVHPRGDDVIFVVTRPDVQENRYRSSLWRLDLGQEGSQAQRFTHGSRDSSPLYSPDGTQIAFLRAGSEGPAQLHVIPATGGDARALTDQPLGVGSFTWSPDSRRLAYTARIPEQGRYGTDEKVSPEQEAPRLIEFSRYQADGVGYVLDRPSHVFLLDLAELDDEADEPALPRSRQLTSGSGDDTNPVFLDGGARVGFLASRTGSGEWIPDTLATDLCSVTVEGQSFTRHTRGGASIPSVHVSPSGQWVYASADLGPSGQDFIARNAVLERDGQELTVAERDHLACAPAVDDDLVVIAVEHRGNTMVRSVPDDTVLLDGDVSVSALATGGGIVAAVAGTPTSYGELFVGPVGGELTPRTDFARSLQDVGAPILPVELNATSSDGYPVHGWLFKPVADQSPPHPVVLMIHGGPYTQYSGNLFDEAQVLAGAGYAVVMGNPRGGSGYGAQHGRVIKEAIGTLDAADLIALLDHALTDPDLDSERVGVQGGSYGGLMTTWLIAHSDRFTAAISERAVNAWDSFAGTSDIGWFFSHEYVGPHEVEQSPLTHADQITTPTLIIHSERDFRCPLEQGQRLFARLRRNGVPAKLLIFPGEGHELSRAGQPRHRVQRFEHILAWWEEYLR